MLLSDGRRVGCLEAGRGDGFPIFHCHGNGSSRFEVTLLSDAAAAAGVRLIGVDRPGIGRSDPAPGRPWFDWPDDVVQIADRLGLHRFAVQGMSAGGAYALACAWRIGTRLTGCSLVSSVSPPEFVRKAAPLWMRGAFWLGLHHPQWVLPAMRLMLPDAPLGEQAVQRRLRRIASWLARPDREVLRRPDIRGPLVHAMIESRRQGLDTSRREILALMQDWKIPMERIAVRNVHLWHGEADRLAPAGAARLLAAALPQCTAHFFAGEGHFSTLAHHARDMFAALSPAATV